MTKQEVLESIKRIKPIRDVDLSGIDLSKEDLSGGYFENVKFHNANFSSANIKKPDLLIAILLTHVWTIQNLKKPI